MNHEVHLLDRHHWRYWLDGNGAWMNRWECTGHDLLLFIVTATGILWMVAEYFYYAHQINGSWRLFVDANRRQHLYKLMQVFMFCGMIHTINLIYWVYTPHMIWAAAYFVNAYFTRKLNSNFRIAVEKSLSESDAESRLKEIGARLDHIYLGDIEPPQKTLRELAEELRRMM